MAKKASAKFGSAEGLMFGQAIPQRTEFWNIFPELRGVGGFFGRSRDLLGLHTTTLGNSGIPLDYVVKKRLPKISSESLQRYFGSNPQYIQLKKDIFSYFRNGIPVDKPAERLDTIIEQAKRDIRGQRGGFVFLPEFYPVWQNYYAYGQRDNKQ